MFSGPAPGALVRRPYYHYRRWRKRVLALICLALKVIWDLAHLFRRRALPARIERVLVVSPLKIGDSLVALPALAALRERYPQARLDVLLRPEVAPLFADVADLDRLVSGATPAERAALRAEQYDLVLVLAISLRDQWRAYRCGGRFRIGYDFAHMGLLLDRRVRMPAQAHRAMVDYPVDEPVRHQAHVWLGLAATLDPHVALRPPRLAIRDADAWRQADDFLRAAEIEEEQPFVVFHPYKPDRHARWLEARWRELAQIVTWKFGVPIVLSGGPGDAAEAEALAASCEVPPAVCAGRLGLRATAALLARSTLVVSVDTGITHLADAVGADVVALFGPGSGPVWRPFQRRHTVLQHTDAPCYGCRQPRCYQPRHYCMEAITVAEVVRAMARFFADRLDAAPAEGTPAHAAPADAGADDEAPASAVGENSGAPAAATAGINTPPPGAGAAR